MKRFYLVLSSRNRKLIAILEVLGGFSEPFYLREDMSFMNAIVQMLSYLRLWKSQLFVQFDDFYGSSEMIRNSMSNQNALNLSVLIKKELAEVL